MRYDVIPGREDCETCRNTGYVIMHGAPRDGRTGMPRFDYPCECGRDPIQHLHDQVVWKSTMAAVASQNKTVSERSPEKE